jgi:hypothetical protein
MTRGKLTEYQRKIRHSRPFEYGALPDYNFPKIRFCSKGHAIIGGNISVSGDEIKCRTCARMYSLLNRKSSKLDETVVRKVLVALQEGKTFHNLAGFKGKRYVGGWIVDVARLNRFCDENPKIGKRIRMLAEKNKIKAASQSNPVRTVKPVIVRVSNDIMDLISAAVPHYYRATSATIRYRTSGWPCLRAD